MSNTNGDFCWIPGRKRSMSESIMNRYIKQNTGLKRQGFTLVEIIIVVVILAIASLMAIPMVSNAADMQVRSAANRIAADLDYAKGMAITHQQSYSVVFNPSGESYQIQDESGTVIEHPVNPGNFVVNFSTDRNLSRVDIVDADFDVDISNAITFDYLGSPYHGIGTSTPLNVGQIELNADNFTLYVKIEPVTGYITIDDSP